MKQTQFNFLRMTAGVIAGMRKEQAIWENEPGIANTFLLIETAYDEINKKSKNIASVDLKGLTADKNNAFDIMIGQIYKLSKKMSGYAKISKDLVLLPLVDFSFSNLSHGQELEIVSRCEAILANAEERSEKLVSFKVTADEINTTKKLIEDYRVQLSKRTSTVKNMPVSAREVDAHIADIRLQLDILDDLIDGIVDDEGFISRYKSWRTIVDFGKGKTLKNKTFEQKEVAV